MAMGALMTASPDRIDVLADIYENHRERVFGLAWKLMGDRQEAEDLTHDVFLRVHDKLDQFEGRSDLGTWIYRIATNLCLNRLRRLRRATLFEAIERTFGLAGGEPDQSVALVADETRSAVREAIDQLPPVYRVCVVLRDLEGRSYREIAEILAVPEGTVMSRLSRGRERLRRILTRRSVVP